MMHNNQKIPNGWSVKKLGDIGVFSKGAGITKNDLVSEGLPCIRYAELYTKYNFIIPDCVSFISEEVSKNAKPVHRGDILFAGSGETKEEIGKCAVYDNPVTAYAGGDNIIFRPEKDNSTFLSYFLNTAGRRYLNRLGQGDSIVHIHADNLKKVFILLPPLAEQEKIAEILGTWDEAIEKLTSLIEQKKLLKKGLMQKLIYTRTNATKYKVADLFELGRGRVISKNEIDTHQGVFPVYSSQTSDNGILGYINTYDFQGEYITWTTDGANAGEVFYRNGKFNCTNVCGTAKAKEKNVNLYYAMSFLNHVSKKYVSYVGNPKLMNGVFAIIPLILPNIEIQNKVADILSTADDEFNLLNQKLEALKEQKNGLMQQLLTGQVRVKVN